MVRLSLILFFVAAIASAHQEADIRMLFDVPQFVPIAKTFRYRVIADDVSNDEGAGVVVRVFLPPQVTFSSVADSSTWKCTLSDQTLTCSADEVPEGPNPIDIDVIAPSQPASLHATATVQSIDSIDPNSKNDVATADIIAFDPGVCIAAAPALLGPNDDSSQPPVVQLAWTAVPSAQSYTIFTSVEGAAAAPAVIVPETSASLVAEPGRSEWWVEASFANCPPVSSAHRHFIAPATLTRPVRTWASGFKSPYGLALSPERDLYVSDEADNVIRKISNGVVSNISGISGQAGNTDGQFALYNGPRGLAVTPFDGFVFAADALNNEVRILYTGGAFVTAYNVGSDFNQPSAIAATERGTLYVADTRNNSIRKMTPVPDYVGLFTVSTVMSGLHSPLGVAVDANAIVYVADTDAGTILKIVGGDAVVKIASDLDHPAGIALDSRGNLFVTDRTGVRRIAPSGLLTTVAAGLDSLAGIVVDSEDRIFVADTANHVIRVIDLPTPRRHVVR